MKKIILITIIIVVCVCGIIITKNIIDIKNKNYIEVVENINDDDELEWWIEESKRREEIIEKEYVSEEMIIELTKSKPNWSKIDISDKSLSKIKENYPQGIFNGEQYDDVKLKEDYNSLVHDTDMGGDTFVLVAKKDKIVDEYIVCGEIGSVLLKNRFGIYTIIKNRIFDENGNRIKYAMDEEHWIENMQKIALQDDEEVGKSEDFYERYPNFTGILNPYHYENISGIDIKWDSSKINYNSRELYCNVYYPSLSEDYELKVTFDTDEHNYLKEYNIDIIKKNEHYFSSDDFKDIFSLATIKRLVYNNRDLSKLNITKSFKNSYNNDIYDIFHCIQIYRIIKLKEIDNKCIIKARDIDNNIIYIGLTYLIDNGRIDKVKFVKLNLDLNVENNSKIIDLLNLF